jgi:hypothetical protein
VHAIINPNYDNHNATRGIWNSVSIMKENRTKFLGISFIWALVGSDMALDVRSGCWTSDTASDLAAAEGSGAHGRQAQARQEDGSGTSRKSQALHQEPYTEPSVMSRRYSAECMDAGS